jgi:hypothetical protein
VGMGPRSVMVLLCSIRLGVAGPSGYAGQSGVRYRLRYRADLSVAGPVR